MRTKLYVGLFVTAIIGIVAGERFFNRLRGAQEPPRTAQAGDKKDVPSLPSLPTAKDTVIVPPPLPTPAGVLPKKDDLPPPLQVPPLVVTPKEAAKPMTFEFPPIGQVEPKPVKKDDAPKPSTFEFPATKKPEPIANPPVDFKPSGVTVNPNNAFQPSTFSQTPPIVDKTHSVPPVVVGSTPADSKKELLAEKMTQVHTLMKENKLKEAEVVLEQMRALDPEYFPAMAAKRMLEARLLEKKESVEPPVKQAEHTPPPVQDTKPLPTVPVPPSPAIAQQIAKLKSSPWSLKIEMVDGQTVVSGTVNHKHTFKIACNSLELNTGKDWLKANGKVTISGDMMTGNCETLQIALLDDRLVLEGGAEVRIQKTLSDAKPTSFELKGDTLNLRISDLHAAKLASSGWRQVSNSSGAVPVRPATTVKDAQWSKWGTLKRMEDKTKVAGETVWCLEDRGAPILILVARDGGTLSQYEGRRISVYGTNEQISGETMLRVSHIALP